MSQTEVATADKAKGRKAPPAAWVFFQRWLANPLSMGSIVPSSVGLRNLVSKLGSSGGSGGGEQRLGEQLGVHPLLLATLFAGVIAALFII